MTKLIDKYLNEAELQSIMKLNNISDSNYPELINFMEDEISAMINDKFKDKEIKDFAIEYGIKYIKNFENKIKSGHSEEWARAFSEIVDDNEKEAFYRAYYHLFRIDSSLAYKELDVYCKVKDWDFKRSEYFKKLIRTGNDLPSPDSFEQSASFLKIYKEQIASGKSEEIGRAHV